MVNIFVEKMHATSHIISLISALLNVQCYTIFSSTDLESDQAISLDVTGKRRLTEIRGYVDSGKYFDSVKKYLCRCGVSPIKWAAHDTDVECTKPEKFGMYHGRPCVMVKLNKVYGWEPEPYYNITEVTLSLFRNTNIETTP